MANPTNEHREQARDLPHSELIARLQDALRVARDDGMARLSADTLASALSALSSRDAEIREVLEGLAKWVNDEWCWCPQVARDGNGALIHFDACVRTSTLYTRLQPPEKSLPGE